MSLTPGSQLGPYEIGSLIGAGGMGEVYRARDKRLERDVAIKVLPAALSQRPDLRQRLEREARTISGLNHPNICTLYDIGETPDGAAFLVMELLEGESLSDRLARGPLPLRQAQKYGAEIADALDRAHRQGIVHRDLKPGNVMITRSGVKLLDFGLAKLTQNDALTDADSPTLQHRDDLTAEGTIVGTLQYMSPEQLEGKVADARSDIFAFGSTLYEMLTGKRAFQANSRAALIASILHDDPPAVSAIAPSVPPAMGRLLEHCLMKEPEDRWQTARDVAIQLRGMSESSGTAAIVALPGQRNRRRTATRSFVVLLLLLSGAASMALWQRMQGADDADRRFSHMSIALSPGGQIMLTDETMVAVAPDGTKVAVIAKEKQGTPQIYLRSLDSFQLAPVPGTEGALSVFFSPDSREIAFNQGVQIKRLPLAGGTAEVIGSAGPGGSWGSDGMVVFNPLPGAPLFRVAATGGPPKQLTKANDAASSQTQPHYLPELGLLLYAAEVDGKSFDEAQIIALSLKTMKTHVVARGTSPRYVAKTGHLLFTRNAKIWRVPFDTKSMTIRGTPKVAAEPVLIHPATGQATYDVLPDGSLIYAPYEATHLYKRLMLVDRNGVAKPMPFPPGLYEGPQLSADGRRLLAEVVGANNDVWLGDVARGTLSRLTTSFENLGPILSPDGRQVIVSLYRADAPRMQILRTDGVGGLRPLAPSPRPRFAYSWSADGSTVAFIEFGDLKSDIYLLRMRSGETVVPLARSRFDEREPALNSDGKWIAYVSDETGRPEVYLRSSEVEGTKVRVSTDGGREPLWSPDGKELFFRNGDAILVSGVTLAPELSTTTPVKLFDFPGSSRDITRSYDITPDGQHFVIVERPVDAEKMRTLNVIRF